MKNDLWVVSCRFDPCDRIRPIRNHRIFSENLSRQGIPHLAVELAFGTKSFLSAEEAFPGAGVIRKRSDSVFWHKERLLSLACRELPPECDKVVWADADVLWPDGEWVDRVRRALSPEGGDKDVVQCFEGAFRLDPDAVSWSDRHSRTDEPLLWEPGTAFRLLSGRSFERSCMGFAWAARRDVLERIGFYERCVLGGGDLVLLSALFGRDYSSGHAPLDADVARWRERGFGTGKTRREPRVGYVGGTVCHLWHGEITRRRYFDRHLVLVRHDYDPCRDLVETAADSPLEWSPSRKTSRSAFPGNPSLHEEVLDYFLSRREDG